MSRLVAALDLRPDETPDLAPHNLEAEQALLGAILFDANALDELGGLQALHFHEPFHARLFEAIRTIAATGLRPEAIALWERFKLDPAMLELGGLRYLADLVDRAPPAITAPTYASVILDTSLRRDLIRLAEETAFAARREPLAALDQLARVEGSLTELARSGDTAKATPIGLDALETIEAARRGEFAGAPVGLQTIERVTGGIRQADVWFIGGRTSIGKSVAGLCLGRGIAENGRGVMMFSLEMPRQEVQARLIADLAYDPEARYDAAYGGNISYGELLKGRGRPDVWDKARSAARRLAELPFVVTDAGGLTIDDIRSRALRQMRAWEKAGVSRGAVLIDHIGLVRPVRRTDSKAADTADTVNELKDVAKQIGVPIIALVQVNRQTENRTDKRPTLADLNWSGAIEQIADLVCLLYRDSYYLERSAADGDWDRAQEVKHELDLLIAKNRSGPICNLKAFVDVASNVIRDLPDAGVLR